mmetsp:Transcript_45261/g.98455  ORF Transcript_45261/g.98455 Transcript_45261/m.98455 type:complete len:226 (+) Transcript_45261:472-1149(+)
MRAHARACNRAHAKTRTNPAQVLRALCCDKQNSSLQCSPREKSNASTSINAQSSQTDAAHTFSVRWAPRRPATDSSPSSEKLSSTNATICSPSVCARDVRTRSPPPCASRRASPSPPSCSRISCCCCRRADVSCSASTAPTKLLSSRSKATRANSPEAASGSTHNALPPRTVCGCNRSPPPPREGSSIDAPVLAADAVSLAGLPPALPNTVAPSLWSLAALPSYA